MTLTGIGGSLGIGITTPDSPLHVAGNAKFGSDVTIVNDLLIGNDLNVTGGSINANVIGNLEGNVYAQSGVSTFANVVFADEYLGLHLLQVLERIHLQCLLLNQLIKQRVGKAQ